MIDQGRVIVADRLRRIVERRQQILLDIPYPGGVLFHTVQYKLNVA